MRLYLLAAALAFSPAVGVASDPATLVTKTFAVADLVTPIPDPASTAKPTTHDGASKLLRTVQTIVRPHSWDALGGPGKLQYFDRDHSLVVTNTQPAIDEVSNLLVALRKLQETSVVTEVRVVAVPVGFREWCPVKCADGALLCEKDVAKFLDFAQANVKVNVMQAPKVTTFDGQTATVRVGEDVKYTTALEVMRVRGQTVFVPKNTPAHIGDALTLCGRVGGDGKTVTLKVNVTRTQVADKVELVPVVTQITPIFEGGSQGKPVPFTQYVQVPDFKTYTAERTATVPNCGTVVVGGWKETHTANLAPPTMSKIPYLNRLFKNVGVAEREVVVLATTRVVAAPHEPMATPVPPQPATPFASQAWDVPVRTQELVPSREGVIPAQVKMDVAVLEVPADFMTKIGLPADGVKDARVWAMTARERDMFAAALRNTTDVKRLSEPTVTIHDGREATFRVGGTTPVVTGLDVTMKNGIAQVAQRTTNVDHGSTVRVTPHVSADGKFVRLSMKATHTVTTESGRKQAVVVPVEKGEPLATHVEELPKQDVQSIEMQVAVPNAGTVVVGGLKPKTATGKATELLIVMTPSAVKATPAAVPTTRTPAQITTDLTKY